LRTLLIWATLVVIATANAAPPNIIVMMTDDQGWGDVGYNGHPVIKTPHLNDMAKSGMRFDRFYATASVCTPSRAAFLTGRNNYRLNIATPGKSWHLLASEITLAEALKTKGYVSGHFGKWHLGALNDTEKPGHKMTPGMAGFDRWFTTPNVLPTYDPYKKGYKSGAYEMYWDNGRNITLEEGRKDPTLQGDDARIVMDKAVTFIEKQAAADKPFFAFICFHTVHTPLGLIPDLAEQYYKELPDDKDSGKIYFSNISAVDRQVGRVRSKLRELGVADNTMLWFCSDNGPNLKGNNNAKRGDAFAGNFVYNHIGSSGPYRGYKRYLYEGGVRVPGVLEWPGRVKEPVVTDFAANMLDIFPTAMAAAGLEMATDRSYDGMSLLPLIDGKQKSRVTAQGFHSQGWNAWTEDRYKIVCQTSKGTTKGEWELYDLIKDPYERINLVQEMPEVFGRMIKDYAKWAESAAADREKTVAALPPPPDKPDKKKRKKK
jgi:arylsulfatase A-like enzyme